MKAEFHGLLDEHAEGLRKPLYLQGRSELAVNLDLRITQPERAAMLYPLARLARVLSKGEVRWSCEALLACAEVGVPVVFLNRDGDVRAYLFGASSGESVLYGRLRACLRRSDGLNRYASWRRAMVDHARQALGGSCSPGTGVAVAAGGCMSGAGAGVARGDAGQARNGRGGAGPSGGAAAARATGGVERAIAGRSRIECGTVGGFGTVDPGGRFGRAVELGAGGAGLGGDVASGGTGARWA